MTATERQGVETAEELGPIGYLVVEYPGNKMTGEGLTALVDLVDRGAIRVLDLMFIRKDDDGSVQALEIEDLDGDQDFSMTIFEGVSSGLLGEDDLAEGGSVLAPNSSAAMLLYENRWAAPFASALRRSGAQVVAAGFIPQDDIVAAIDELDADIR
jgi:hypothetical protein